MNPRKAQDPSLITDIHKLINLSDDDRKLGKELPEEIDNLIVDYARETKCALNGLGLYGKAVCVRFQEVAQLAVLGRPDELISALEGLVDQYPDILRTEFDVVDHHGNKLHGTIPRLAMMAVDFDPRKNMDEPFGTVEKLKKWFVPDPLSEKEWAADYNIVICRPFFF